jgi:hypothetical protein
MAWVILNDRNSGRAERFNGFTSNECTIIRKLWGERIAVVTAAQTAKLIQQGVPQLSDFLFQHVDDTLSQAKDFPRYLAFAGRTERYKQNDDNYAVVRYMVRHPDLMADLGLRFTLTPETELMVAFLGDRYQSRLDKLPKCRALAEKVTKSPALDKVLHKLTQSPWARYVDLGTLSHDLGNLSPGSPECAIPYELTRKLLQ